MAQCAARISDRRQVDALVEQARLRNERNAVTGALIYSGSHFAQYLEGPPDALKAIIESILEDDRHEQITIVREDVITERRYPSWSLAFKGKSFFVDGIIRNAIDRSGSVSSTNRLFRLVDEFARLEVSA